MEIHRFQPPLTTGIVIRRYKRFFIDVQLDSGDIITAHCVNTGSMASVYEPGRRAALSPADKPDRKLKWTLEAILVNQTWVGVNTHRSNFFAGAIIQSEKLDGLNGYSVFKSEVRYAGNHRIDWLLSDPALPDCYVEVKNTTLMTEPGVVSFPDSVSERGRLHLEALTSMVTQGYRATNLFLVNRSDATTFKPADSIDPAYGQALRQAHKAGVKLIAVCLDSNPETVQFTQTIPVIL